MKKRVVFDLGGVIVRWEPGATQTGFLSANEWDTYLQTGNFYKLNELLDRGYTPAEVLTQLRDYNRDEATIFERFIRHYPRSLRGLIPGMEQLVGYLHANAHPTAVISNWSAQLFEHARAAYPLIDALGPRLISGAIGITKPDREIFHLAQTVFNTPASQMLLVDDREENVNAAIATGMDGIVFTDAAQLAAQLHERGILTHAQTQRLTASETNGRLAP